MFRTLFINLLQRLNTGGVNDLVINKHLFDDNYTTKIISKSGEATFNNLTFHYQPDGADIFEDTDPKNTDGYLYVSNSEIHSRLGLRNGGVGVYKFDKNHTLIDYYRILENTRSNCSGGKYKNYWLSCEEYNNGRVWLTDPFGKEASKALPSMGRFSHEAVAYCSENGSFYLTEDTKNSGGGYIYRYTPENGNIGDIEENGQLEICVGEKEQAKDLDKPIYKTHWEKVDTRYTPLKFNQKPNELKKTKWEGIVYSPKGFIFISNQNSGIYCYNIRKDAVMHISNTSDNEPTELNHPDNIYITKNNNLLVAGNDLQIWLYTFNYETNTDFPVLEKKEVVLTCKNHQGSELTGLAVYKDILMFASQRGSGKKGIVYQIKGFKDEL